MDLKNMGVKDYVLTFLKGILLGLISMGIPGLSASTIGLIIGIYLIMVEAIANVFKDFKNNFRFLIILILGYSIGAILAAFSVTILFEKFPLATTIIILGMIIGSIPSLIINLKSKFKNIPCLITFIVVFVGIILYNFLITKNETNEFPTNPNIGYLIKILIIGIVTSSTFIIPGVDFALVFLSLGLYYPFMNMITDILSFGNPNYSIYIINYLKILGFYLVGYFTGIFLFSKLIKFLSNKYYYQTQFASFAFVASAPIIVLRNCLFTNSNYHFNVTQLIIGIILGIMSLFIMIYIGKKNRLKNES